MHIEPAAILALISTMTGQNIQQENEIATLRVKLEEKDAQLREALSERVEAPGGRISCDVAHPEFAVHHTGGHEPAEADSSQ